MFLQNLKNHFTFASALEANAPGIFFFPFDYFARLGNVNLI